MDVESIGDAGAHVAQLISNLINAPFIALLVAFADFSRSSVAAFLHSYILSTNSFAMDGIKKSRKGLYPLFSSVTTEFYGLVQRVSY
jgi:hypothetical protein